MLMHAVLYWSLLLAILRRLPAIFPAAYRKVIAVASTEQHQQRFYQSNFGASVDIGAPGNVILSTQINNQYRLLTGTSMASPHVAGVAALILAKRPALTHEEVRHILINTADPVNQEDSDVLDEKFVGAGTVNAERALLASSALQARILAPETNSGGSDSITIIGTVGGYKFHSWQLSYGESTVPVEFTPFTESDITQKIGGDLGGLGYDNRSRRNLHPPPNSNSHRRTTDTRPSCVEYRPNTASSYLPYRNRNALR